MIDSADMTGKLAIDANGLGGLRNSARDNSPEAIRQVARQFEAIFMNMMLKSMRDATPQEGAFDSEQSRTFISMLDQQLSQNLASKGLGLADILTRQLSKTGDTRPPESTAGNNADNVSVSGTSSSNPFTNMVAYLRPEKADTEKSAQVAAPTPSPAPLSHDASAFHMRMASHAEEASRSSGIPAHYMLGQAALESGWGKREINGMDGTPSHNLFGIKATGDWKGKVVEAMTTEYIHGIKQKRIEKFRAYDSYADSFRDFASLIRNNPRYQGAIANLDNVKEYAQGLQKGGYATDPNYASKLVSVIQKITGA